MSTTQWIFLEVGGEGVGGGESGGGGGVGSVFCFRIISLKIDIYPNTNREPVLYSNIKYKLP